MRQFTYFIFPLIATLLSCARPVTYPNVIASSGPGTSFTATVEKPTSENNALVRKKKAMIESTEILWDKWGVPHIYAKSNDDLFYSFGWAQMHSHANTILKLYGQSRGRAAEYWGKDFIENDMMVHTLDFPSIAKQWYIKQSPEFQRFVDAFVRGMNEYASRHPQVIEDKYKDILPVHHDDIFKHSLFVIYSRFVGGNDLSQVSQWEERGSNTYAIAPKRSASGNAMLVMNPHLPWFDEWLFYEAHLNTSEMNTYGATLLGLPVLGIAFNEKLGWSHTNNTIDNADRYEITLKDGGYVVDGEVRQFEKRKALIKVKKEDGLFDYQEIQLLSSEDHGAVLKQNGSKSLAIKMPGFDRPYGIVQWWNMGRSRSLEEFKDNLREVQIPFFNIMYADQKGNIFYMFNGQIPVRKVDSWDHWSGIVDGSKSINLWSDIHPFEDLPKVENPNSGWLQNANDPPWTSTFPRELDPENFPGYIAPVTMSFRPQRAVRMIEDDKSISFEELMSYKLSTRLEMADRLLDDLFFAIDLYGGESAKEAKVVLENWDREANADSKGMALFYAWAHILGPWNRQIYDKQWSLTEARTTPDGLSDPLAAVKSLEGVVEEFKKIGRPLDIPWGEVYRIKYGNKDLPGNGSDGSVGQFRVAWSNGQEEDGTYTISGGDSWQGIIEFGDRVKAKVLMSYGNSTQKDSKNYGDQLELFSKKEMRECHYYRDDVLDNVLLKEVLVDGDFGIPKD